MNSKYTAILSLLFVTGIDAKGLNINPSIETSLVDANTEFSQQDDRQSTTLSIAPELSMDYTSKQFRGQVNASVQHLQQDINNTSSNNNYTNYGFSGDLSLIENYLRMRVDGKQSYRNPQSNNFLSSDQFLASEQLSKTKNNSLSLDFTLPRPRYIGINLSGTVAQIDSSKQVDSETALKNKNTTLQARIYQGREIRNVSWNINGSYRNNDSTVNNDLRSTMLNADVYIGLADKLRLVLKANSEENTRSAISSFPNGGLSSDSYGAGLAWFISPERNINVTYNQFSRPNVADENFVGFDLNWNFTSRTSVKASYEQRFFGKSGDFSLSHNTKHLRTSVTYNERLTTFSRIITETQDAGQFVCALGVVSISDCFQPDSTAYELQAGEQLLNFTIDVPDISNEIILRKSLNANIGFARRKVSMALTLGHTATDYVDSDREQTNNSLGLSSSYKAGPKTSFNLGLNYIESDRGTEEQKLETKVATLGMSRKIGRNLSTNASLRYLDRSSDVDINNLTDRRLTLSMQYRF